MSAKKSALAHGRGETSIEFQALSVAGLLAQAVQTAGDSPALIIPASAEQKEQRWTYAELESSAQQAARALLAHFSAGDRVATWAGGTVDIIILQLAAAMAGVVLVTINPANRGKELEYMLVQSEARGLFLSRDFRGMNNEEVFEPLRGRLAALKTAIYMDQWAEFVCQGDARRPLPDVAPTSPCLILFTSGSTGKPKAAVISHQAVVNNAYFAARRLEMKPGAVWLNVLPMFHVGGSVTMLLGALSTRGSLVHMSEFNPEAMLAALDTHRVEITMAVPTMLLAMMDSADFEATDLSALRLIVTGGTAVPPELVRQVGARMGAEVMSLMGQTEAGGTMFCTRPGDSEDQVTRSVGGPLANSEVKIQNTADGSTAAVGEIGEICVLTHCRMLEYFGMPEKTREAIDEGGWLHTGDLGCMRPDGYVQVTGRLKEMIIRGGENIYPREIEDELVEHADVAQAAVFGVPDEKWGEQVAVALILRPGAVLDVEELTTFLQARIARHKVPKVWRQMEVFPLNASGKIQKFILQEQFAGERS